MKMEETECSETSAYKFQTPGIHPKESIQHSVQGDSLKSRCLNILPQKLIVKLSKVIFLTDSTTIFFIIAYKPVIRLKGQAICRNDRALKLNLGHMHDAK